VLESAAKGTLVLEFFFPVCFKIPETKGMHLEIITEFFAVGASNRLFKTRVGGVWVRTANGCSCIRMSP
jgi:hypothetical protein